MLAGLSLVGQVHVHGFRCVAQDLVEPGRDDYCAATKATRWRTAPDALTLRLKANPEEIEEDLECRQRRYREDHSE